MGKPTITKSKDGDPNSGTISLSPPDLTDEETQDNFMPAALRCDACLGISDRYAKALQVLHCLLYCFQRLSFVFIEVQFRCSTE